jgi:hypothetical protein
MEPTARIPSVQACGVTIMAFAMIAVAAAFIAALAYAGQRRSHHYYERDLVNDDVEAYCDTSYDDDSEDRDE